MSNMPRLGIKRAFENILTQELKANYIQGAFTTGVKRKVQVSIPTMQEEYDRVAMQSKLKCTLSITFEVFSEVSETGVHQVVYDLIQVKSNHPLLKEYKIDKIYPSSSFTGYNEESSDGHVSAQVILNMEYLM